MNNEYTALMDKLGYRFRDPRLLEDVYKRQAYEFAVTLTIRASPG